MSERSCHVTVSSWESVGRVLCINEQKSQRFDEGVSCPCGDALSRIRPSLTGGQRWVCVSSSQEELVFLFSSPCSSKQWGKQVHKEQVSGDCNLCSTRPNWEPEFRLVCRVKVFIFLHDLHISLLPTFMSSLLKWSFCKEAIPSFLTVDCIFSVLRHHRLLCLFLVCY